MMMVDFQGKLVCVIRHDAARALFTYTPEFRKVLKKADFLSHNTRMKETLAKMK